MDKTPGNWKPHPHSVTRNKDLSSQAYRVWAVIRSHEDTTGQTELSNDTISKESNLNRKTVQRAKKELADLGLISILASPKNQHQGASKYQTNVPGQKRPSKETIHTPTRYPSPKGSVPSPSWNAQMLPKHDCLGCGHCHQCREYEYSQSQPKC